MTLSNFLYKARPIPALLLIFLSLLVFGSILNRCDKTQQQEIEYIYDTTKVEIIKEVPVPYKIYIVDTVRIVNYISITDTVYKTAQIDTAAILSDYFKVIEYIDTVADESLKFYLNEKISQNRIISRKTSYQWLEPTQVITNETNMTIYAGLSFLQTDKLTLMPSIYFANPKMYGVVGIGLDKSFQIGAGLKILSW